MTTKLVVGLDGLSSGDKALEYGKKMASLIGDCEMVLLYVIEWSPYSFQTPEENAERHKRREQEIELAMSRIVLPAEAAAKEAGFKARGIVRHGDVAGTLDAVAVEENANQIIIGRTSDGGFASWVVGGVPAKLVMNASVPVTVIN